MRMKKVYLSVIVPFYNEADNLPKLHRELVEEVLSKHRFPSEILYVDDGSSDHSSQALERAAKIKKSKWVRTTMVTLRRNSGQTAALMAGISSSSGQVVSFLDADLQNDPKDITKLLAHLDRQTDVVLGWRKQRKDDFLRTGTSRIANGIIRLFFRVPIHDSGCSLRLVRRAILSDIKLYGESHRIMSVILYWKGARIKEVAVNHRKRNAGKSKYNYSRIIKLVIDLMTVKFLNSYSTRPAYLFGSLGLLCNLVALVPLAVVSYEKIFQAIYVHRNPLFIIAIFLMLLGVQFILMGLIAELLVRTYFESQHKNIFDVVRIKKLT